MEFDPNRNPWECTSSKIIYENPWIKVIEDKVLRPNKTNGIYGKVLFKNKAIGIIPVDENLNTWLVGQYRYTLNEYSWEIPTGGVPFEENTIDGAKRELKEETGLITRKLTKLLKVHTSNSVTDEYGYVFLAEALSQGEMNWDETEELQIKKLPLKKALEMVIESQITDSLSICGILRAANVFGL